MTKKPNVESEVRELRKDAARLTRDSEARDRVQEAPKKAAPRVERKKSAPPLAKGDGSVGGVQDDVKAMPAIVAVGFFALGVLMGSLLRR